MLLDGKEIITWPKLEERIASLPDPRLAHPHFYVTRGAREAGAEKLARQWRWRLHRTFKLKGHSVGSLWPRSDFRFDRIKTAADLVPDKKLRVEGRVLDRNGKPLANAEVLLIIPVDESISYKAYHVALVEGRVRNQLEHVMTHSDKEGRFFLHPPKEGNYYIVAVHPAGGFRLIRSTQFVLNGEVKVIPWGALISLIEKEEGLQQEVSLSTSVRESKGWPEVVFNQYWSDLKQKQPTEIFGFTHVPPIYRTQISRNFQDKKGVSIGLPAASVSLLPGEARQLGLGPLSEQQKALLERRRREVRE